MNEQKPEPLTAASRDVLAERRRQVEVEGWTPAHDDEHSRGEMGYAAACYASTGSMDPSPKGQWKPEGWPWEAAWWKPGNRRRNLVKAGALVLAEIERYDRASSGEAASAPQGGADDFFLRLCDRHEHLGGFNWRVTAPPLRSRCPVCEPLDALAGAAPEPSKPLGHPEQPFVDPAVPVLGEKKP